MPVTVILREHVAGAPHALLQPYVGRYGGFAERTDGPVRRRELPIGGVAVILSLGHGWLIDGEPQRSFAGGLIDRPVVSEHAGASLCLQFDLTPLGALALFGVPGAAELRDRVVALDDLLGRATRELVERLAEAVTWEARFALLDDWLLPRVLGASAARADVAWAWERLVATGGAVPISELVRELGCSRRHLATRFGEAVGMTPKAYGRLLRFERAVGRLRDAADADLGRIAADCGFSDQAHFTRELTAFAGAPPTTLRAEAARPGAGFIL